MYGKLIPIGGGDPIPLLKQRLLVGRRESCDVVLRFANVSAHHCQFKIEDGYWYIKDLNSRNGTKVNNQKITRCRLEPGDKIAVAKHQYEIQYNPLDLGAIGPPPRDEEEYKDVLSHSLLHRAKLDKRSQILAERAERQNSDRSEKIDYTPTASPRREEDDDE